MIRKLARRVVPNLIGLVPIAALFGFLRGPAYGLGPAAVAVVLIGSVQLVGHRRVRRTFAAPDLDTARRSLAYMEKPIPMVANLQSAMAAVMRANLAVFHMQPSVAEQELAEVDWRRLPAGSRRSQDLTLALAAYARGEWQAGINLAGAALHRAGPWWQLGDSGLRAEVTAAVGRVFLGTDTDADAAVMRRGMRNLELVGSLVAAWGLVAIAARAGGAAPEARRLIVTRAPHCGLLQLRPARAVSA